MQTNPPFPITKYGILYIFLLQQISQKKEKKMWVSHKTLISTH